MPVLQEQKLVRFHLTMDTLAVRLTVPLAGSAVDFHHQVIQPPPRVLEQRQARRYAPCLAHIRYKDAHRAPLFEESPRGKFYFLP